MGDRAHSIALPAPRWAVRPTTTLLCALCVLVGFTTSRDPLLAAALIGFMLISVLLAVLGIDTLTRLTIALLPLSVVLVDVTPRASMTIFTAFVVLLMLTRFWTPMSTSRLAWIGTLLFVMMVLTHAVGASASGEFISAAKYLLFPAVVLIVANPAARNRLAAFRRLLLFGGVGAMMLQATAMVLQIGPAGQYYEQATYAGTGARFGLTPNTPHAMALLGVTVAIACLITIRDIRWRLATAGVAAIPALATSIRSALVALVLGFVFIAIRDRLKLRIVFSMIGIGLIVVASGVGGIIAARYEQGQKAGEYSNVKAFGSGRGLTESKLLESWMGADIERILFGSGLRSPQQILKEETGNARVAQSDPLTTGIELGVVGLVAWLLLWLAIVRSRLNLAVLIPLATYVITSGVLEYVGAEVYGVILAAACAGHGMVASAESGARSTRAALSQADTCA